MTIAMPAILPLAGAAMAAVVIFHLFARQRPPEATLPTARFVPSRRALALSRSRRLSDRGLLALRLTILALLAAAIAGISLPRRGGGVRRVVLVDASRAVASMTEARDSALAWLRPGDALVLLDSIARPVPEAPADTLHQLPSTVGRLSLSAGLLAAMREAQTSGASADSVELIVVSPLVREEIDAATLGIRDLWPGRIRIVRTAAAEHVTPAMIAVRAAPDDPVAVAVRLSGREESAGNEPAVRIVRDRLTAQDSTWAAAAEGRVIVSWPAAATVGGDTVGAVVSEGGVLIAPFFRPAVELPAGAVRARWIDGRPAVIERRSGASCVREVQLAVDPRSDLALTPSFARFVDAVAAPCGGRRDMEPADEAILARLAGSGPLASAGARPLAEPRSTAAAWLLGVVLLLIGVEMIVRRRRRAS